MAKTAKVVGGRFALNRDCRIADGGWAPVEIIGHHGDWLVRCKDGVGGDEYPADPLHLRTFAEAAAGLIPKVRGKEREFRAHGKTFRVKKHGYRNFSLFADDVRSRSRWGNLAEITADVAHVIEFGALPPASGTPGI